MLTMSDLGDKGYFEIKSQYNEKLAQLQEYAEMKILLERVINPILKCNR